MTFLERKVWFMRVRAWGLVLNFLANGLALYGLSRVLAGEGGEVFLLLGAILTAALIAVLAIPVRHAETAEPLVPGQDKQP